MGRDMAAEQAATYIAQIGGERKEKISVTVDAALWQDVKLQAEVRRTTVSALVEEALALRSANFRLRQALEQTYREFPESRPTEEQVEAARRKLYGAN